MKKADKKTKLLPWLSFPRSPEIGEVRPDESRCLLAEKRESSVGFVLWIPAFAGMTIWESWPSLALRALMKPVPSTILYPVPFAREPIMNRLEVEKNWKERGFNCGLWV